MRHAAAASLAVLVLTLAAAGCAARMKVAPALEDGAEGWAVTGARPRTWGAPIAFGPWRVGAADEAGRGWSADALGLDAKAAAAAPPYGARVEGPAGAMELECRPQRLEAVAPFGAALDLEALGGRLALACALRPAGASGWTGAWTLLLRSTGQPTQAYEGELRDARGVTFSIRSVHQLASGDLPAGPPAGWAIDREGTPAAAVEILEGGRVLVARRESEPAALATAAAALLLFQPAP